MKWLMTIVMVVLLVACQEDKPADFGLEGYDPDAETKQRAACDKRGGRFGSGGISGALVCFETPKDAGQSCKKSTDCSGSCLARSKTCSPLKPLFGCNEVITATGAVATLCLE